MILQTFCIIAYAYQNGIGQSVVNVLDIDVIASEFELKSSFYVYIRTNTLEKYMEFTYSPFSCR